MPLSHNRNPAVALPTLRFGERLNDRFAEMKPASDSATTHTTEKTQKRTRPRLRGAAHPLKGPPTTHHGEQELRGTPWCVVVGQPHTVQDTHRSRQTLP